VPNSPIEPPEQLYARPFYSLFVALLCFMGGVSLLVHLRKYIALGTDDVGAASSVFDVGLVGSIGMIGSLATRPFVGTSIDRVGCRRILWLASVLGAITLLGFLISTELWLISALRVVLQLSQATFLAAIAVAAARIAPPNRSAESLAMIGMGGLLGLMLGPMLGDLIFAVFAQNQTGFSVFFVTAASLMLASLVFIRWAEIPLHTQLRADHESFFVLVARHKPGAVVIVALCLAMVQTVPIMFIEAFVEARQLAGVTLFFLAYSPTAIILRIVLRRLPERLGRRRTLIMGMIAYPIGLVLLTRVHTTAGLILPAIVMGTGHCFTYPFLVDLAADSMPPQHRGAATAMILGVLDLGFLAGFLIVGTLIHCYGFDISLYALATITALGVVAYSWSQRGSFVPIKADI